MKVTVEQLEAIEVRLERKDRIKIASMMGVERGVVTQVIKYKAVHLKKAYSVYVFAKALLDERDKLRISETDNN